MRRMKYFAYLSAIALASMLTLSACSSSEDAIDNPDYNPEDNTVKTEFAISLPNNVAGKTRASASTVQAAGYADFRGLKGIYLLPFATTVTTDNVSTAAVNGSAITLGDVTKTGGAHDLDNAKKNTVVYNDVAVQTGTSSFIFYAKSGETVPTDHSGKFQYGLLNAINLSSSMTSVNSVEFGLEAINNSSQACAGSNIGARLVTILTEIAQATDTGNSDGHAWSATTNTQLHGLYDNFISMKAGSSKNVESALGHLYGELKATADNNSLVDCAIAVKIRDMIKGYCPESAQPADDATTITLKDEYQGYPADVYLPDGAARVNWVVSTDPTNPSHFEGMSTISNIGDNFASTATYVYQPGLYYWTNSGLVAAASKKSGSYGNGDSWADVVKTSSGGVYESAESSVSSSTRSIALVNQIEYAVGRLDTKVRINKTSESSEAEPVLVTLLDAEGTTVAKPESGFTLTGILIGGQKSVGWNFEPQGTSAVTIYDKDIVSGIAANTYAYSAVNHTLALETEANTDVNIALEFTNGSQRFKGHDGYIAPGGKFYLIASLDPKSDGNGTNQTNTGNKVFKQDYVTYANFTIGANSLAKAYSTLPDLRMPQLELGLAVNLEWKSGITFDVEF